MGEPVVAVYAEDGRVSVVPMARLTERAYGLGRLDQLAADVEALRRGLPPVWYRKALDILEEPR